MTKYNIAAEMDKALNSEENKQMFSTSSMLEKLAFSKVSDEGKEESEVEKELTKTASAADACIKCYSKKPAETGVCKCACKGPADCAKGCDCKCGGGSYEKSMASKANSDPDTLVKTASEKLLEVSAALDEAGFERLAAFSAMLVETLMSEAKAKKSKKAPSKKDKDMKARMKKMQDAKKAKEKAKKDKDSKSSKDSKTSKEEKESAKESEKEDKKSSEKK